MLLLLVVLIILSAIDLYQDRPPVPPSVEPKMETKATQIIPVTPESSSVAAVEREEAEPIQTEPIKPEPPAPNEIKVEVLNGCGAQGIASRVRDVLRQRGFDVMSYGNAGRMDYRKSLILIRSETSKSELAAQVVANSLGITTSQIRAEKDPSSVDIDVAVILGSDYRKLDLK